MRCVSILPVLALGALVACSQAEPADVPPPSPPVPSESLTRAPQLPDPVELTEDAEKMKAAILREAERGALRSLGRLASRQEGFVSNVGGQDHYEFWDLLRRTGVDPNRKIRELFEGPPGKREVDGQTWFVWPDIAAKEARDLIPEKLTFVERRRLRELVGEDGIARIRAGEGYPGMRTAISADGRWVYFVLGQDGED